MLDLDGFKRVNDSLGHAEGDKVLKRVAAVLSANVRQLDTIARFGGDEFVIVLPETPRAVAAQVAERALAQIALERLDEGGVVGASLGIASIDFADGGEVDEELLLRRADHAMLYAKRAGKNQVLHFDDCPEDSPLSVRATRPDN
jgi:diguanylate cyclase (GGDEF)-like protein